MLAPADAKRALGLPVYVVAENGESDKAFLDAMMRALGRTVLRRAFEKQWCEIISSGGCGEIEKRVIELLQKTKTGPRRIFVLSDSDRLRPDNPNRPNEKTDSMRIAERCDRIHGVKAVVLNKREMENYLPIEALEQVQSEKQRVLRAFRQLGQIQRDHYDMKNGFEQDKDGQPDVPSEQTDLFHDVDRNLCGGFGEKIWKLFEESPNDIITKATIRATCSNDPDEIDRILDTLEGLI
jgi:hypothetical protein